MVLEPIAIVGIGCRYPGADSPNAFWHLLRDGVDAIGTVPSSRWDLAQLQDIAMTERDKASLRWGGFLQNIDRFDPQFFGIAPREVRTMDPQQRLLLEVTWEALEDAGIVPDRLKGSRTGVFVGIGTHDYSILLWQEPVDDPYATTGTGNCIAANRISYVFDLKGPSLAIDTACSSSLVAVHLACQSLWSGESDLALAGGVNVLLLPNVTLGFASGGFMSSSGRCRSFDASADGYVRSEGAGMVLLKPLSQALAEADPIYAVIRGSAVNQDGFSNGIAAPNVEAQKQVLREAYQRAGRSPGEVQYIEAHGTGTRLGDPVELTALGSVLAEGRAADRVCAIGSVKTNIGHTETAAGIAGLIKVALCLKHRQIPPSLHFTSPNPQIDFDGLALRVQDRLTSWPASPALAGVNSFGFGGTNAHIVVEEPPSAPEPEKIATAPPLSDRPLHLLTLSTRSEPALRELAQRYGTLLDQQPTIALADLCFTANTRRSPFPHRLTIVSADLSQLRHQLNAFVEGREEAGVLYGVIERQNPPVVFLFTGQGSQYVGMGRQLYETQPVFREAIDQCDGLLRPDLKRSLVELLYTDVTGETEATLEQTLYTQPALFAVEYALAQFWLSWGVKPAAVMGHSIGEYVAACLAGVFSLEDGLRLVAARGRLMHALPPSGGMVSVLAEEAWVRSLIAQQPDLSIAAVNGPQSTVVSGTQAAIAWMVEQCLHNSIKTIPLKVSHAFHSPLMTPMLSKFKRVAAKVTYHPPQWPIVSTVTGQWVDDEIATPDYWCRHVCQPVQFARGITTLWEQGYRHFLEIGAQPILSGLGQRCIPDRQTLWLPSLRPGQSDWQALLSTLAALNQQGVEIQWAAGDRPFLRRVIHLPTYPFQRQRYWWEGESRRSKGFPTRASNPISPTPSSPLLGERMPPTTTDEIRFQLQLNSTAFAYLSDHRIAHQTVFPAAAYLEMAIAAGHSIGWADPVVEAFRIERALILSPFASSSIPTTVHLVLTPQDGHYACHILSRQSHDDPWVRHATGTIASRQPSPPPVTLTTLQAPFLDPPLAVAAYYQQLQQQQLNYGPHFQAIQELWAIEGQALSLLQLPAAIAPPPSSYHLHPVLLDAAFQSIAAALGGTAFSETHVPVRVESFRVYSPLQASAQSLVWSWVKVHQPPSPRRPSLRADLYLFNPTGEPVAEVLGLELHPLRPSSLNYLFKEKFKEKLRHDWVYELTWQPARDGDRSTSDGDRHWLVVSPGATVALPLVEALQREGDRCTLATTLATPSPSIHTVDPLNMADFQRLVALAEPGMPVTDIVCLWAVGPALDRPSSPYQAELERCSAALHLVQALIQHRDLPCPRLWWITQNTQAVVPSTLAVNLHGAALWGLARTLRLEHPELPCRCIDVDHWDDGAIAALVADLRSPNREDQIAHRQGNRYVARLASQAQGESTDSTDAHTDRLELSTLPVEQPFRVALTQYGLLDHLTLKPTQRRPPQPGEVEIQVRAAGLNFRDVLNALGMLQPYLEQMGFATADAVPFGGECAGVVVAVGAGVTPVQVGDAVIAAPAIGSLAQYVTVPASCVVGKPSNLSFVEAATLPTAFLTALYGLEHLARLQRGDRILIHAAASGVGLAAVQLAHLKGAEVYATASVGKWDFLQSLGVKHIFNSRTLDFTEAILQDTHGQGVDVVLNSLNGDYIPRSLATLAPGGRFVEIGKLGIWTTQQVHEQRPDVRYCAFDLLDVAQHHPDCITQLLQTLVEYCQQGAVQPLQATVFDSTAVVSAFRYMAQARHIGKVVITFPPFPPGRSLVAPQLTYLVTGGLGFLGLQAAQWLASQGATSLMLVGRKSPSKLAQHTIDHLHAQGVDVVVTRADITQPEDVAALLPLAPFPLRGIIHAAGVLDDGILQNLTWQRWEPVLATKLAGAWNLHEATRSLPLDFFIGFSSAAALMGSAGQGSYAAANAALDTLMHYRRQLGLPGLSINWSAWDGGMVSQLPLREQQRLLAQGMTLITPEQGFPLLEDALRRHKVQVGVLPLAWDSFLRQGSHRASPSFFERVMPPLQEEHPPIAPPHSPSSSSHPPSSSGNWDALQHQIQTQLAKVLGFSTPEQIDPRENFADLGMDSLMAVELTNSLQAMLGCPLSQSTLFDHPTIASLTEYLAATLPLPSLTRNEQLEQPAPTPPNSQTLPPHPVVLSPGAIAANLSQSASAPLQPPSVNRSALNGSSEAPNPMPTVLKSSIPAPAPIASDLTAIPEAFYQFHLMPEYLQLQADLQGVEPWGNPFFMAHDGIARDTVSIDGKTLINFASYNYLGMSGDPRVTEAAIAAVQQYGTSVSASRVVAGERPIHRELEQELAQFLGTEECIVYIGGHTTNVSTIGHLFGERDLVLYDALSHNSIRQGCDLSGATLMDFPHNDWHTLEKLLKHHRLHYEKVLIAVEGIYSADGDLATLPQIVELKKRFKTFLLVDEAHSIGVLGHEGRGIGEHFTIPATDVDLWMGTLSKSFASCGGYIAGGKPLIEYLKYTSPGFVYSVGMSPANAAAALAALRVLQAEPHRVEQLQRRSRSFLKQVKKLGLNTGMSHNSPVIPIIVGEPPKAIELSQRLLQQGIHVQPMVFPSVPYNASRLRFFLSCLHTEEQINFTVAVLANYLPLFSV